MTVRRFVQAVSIAAVALLVLVASARANPIGYNTNYSVFNGVTGLTTLFSTNTAGVVASLVYEPTDTSVSPSSPVSPPSGINYGRFTLTCPLCTIQAGTSFDAFTFNLVVFDTTDGGLGMFVGSAAAATVFSDSTTLQINWQPLQLGPGTNTPGGGGTFGSTIFRTTNPTQLVAPNSGEILGRTTIEGIVFSDAVPDTVPEPMTFVLIGTGLVGLGLLRRKAGQS